MRYKVEVTWGARERVRTFNSLDQATNYASSILKQRGINDVEPADMGRGVVSDGEFLYLGKWADGRG